MTQARRRAWLIARDVLPVVLVAWLVFHEVRTGLMQRYLVPSRSMEPTLHGDEVRGDVVLVDKTAWWSWRRGMPRPFDLVVVRNPSDARGNDLVKRFVTAGPCTVRILAGDVWRTTPDDQVARRIVKHPLAHPDLRQTAFEIDGPCEGAPELDFLQPAPAAWSAADGVLRVAAMPRPRLEAALAAPRDADRPQPDWPFLSTARSLDSSFLDATGTRAPAGHVDVRDVGLELDLAVAGDADVDALWLVVELLETRHLIRYTREGGFQIDGGDPLPSAEVVAAPSLGAGTSVRVRFGYLDGAFFATVDERLVLWHALDVPWSSPREVVLPSRYRKPPANLLHVGVEGRRGGIAISRIRAFHDAHYGAGDLPEYRLEIGDLFLLGDNSFDSRDSRDLVARPFRIDDLIGAPVAILAPFDRMRRL